MRKKKNVQSMGKTISQLVDKLVGKYFSITYRIVICKLMFRRQLVLMAETGSAKWNINGKVLIHRQIENKDSS